MCGEMWAKRQGPDDEDIKSQVKAFRLDYEGHWEPEEAELYAVPTSFCLTRLKGASHCTPGHRTQL